jgi:hypothetical protein
MSHHRSRSPSDLDKEVRSKYQSLSPDKLKEEYLKVYHEFTTHYHDTEIPTLLYPEGGFFSFIASTPKPAQVIDEIIALKKRMIELQTSGEEIRRLQREANLKNGFGNVTDSELAGIRHGQQRDQQRFEQEQILERQRTQNAMLGVGPFTNLEVATQRGTYTEDTAPRGFDVRKLPFTWQQGDAKYSGGKSKRAKKAKRVKKVKSKRAKRATKKKRRN